VSYLTLGGEGMSTGKPWSPEALPLFGEEPSLPETDVFEVLSNERRQCILHYLKRQDDRRVSLRELVDHVAAWENDTTVAELESDERKRVYTALRQNHLPKLDDTDIVEYDHMRGEVALTEDAREVELYLEYVPGNDIPWSEFYLGLSAVGAALVFVTWLEIGPFASLSGLTLAAILVGVFALSAAVHTYDAAGSRIGSEEFEVGER
jgi:hypothetical protein